MLTGVPAALGSAAKPIVPHFDRIVQALRHRWYFAWFVFGGSARCRALKLGEGNRLYVPVRSDGAGSLIIGADNNFGFRKAPRAGNGEVLLQARKPDSEIIIGNRNSFSNNISIVATQRITFGDECLVGDQVLIFDGDAHAVDPRLRRTAPGPSLPVTVGNNVWLGSRVVVLKGVTIGDNSVIAAMSLVNRSIPPNSIAAGIPARVIRTVERS